MLSLATLRQPLATFPRVSSRLLSSLPRPPPLASLNTSDDQTAAKQWISLFEATPTDTWPKRPSSPPSLSSLEVCSPLSFLSLYNRLDRSFLRSFLRSRRTTRQPNPFESDPPPRVAFPLPLSSLPPPSPPFLPSLLPLVFFPARHFKHPPHPGDEPH
jgi:hypothetical protein